jgi:hypothetical protein
MRTTGEHKPISQLIGICLYPEHEAFLSFAEVVLWVASLRTSIVAPWHLENDYEQGVSKCKGNE